MKMSERFRKALTYAAEVHAEQVRKGDGGVPYIGHLLGVCGMVIEDGGDEDEAIGALLHDAAEDQGGRERLADIRERFGERVASIVGDCSDTLETPKPPWRQRKERYVAHLETADPSVLRVSVSDKIYNVQTMVADLRAADSDADRAAFWGRFNAGPEEQLWYYGSLLDVFRRRNASKRLVPEMDRLLGDLIGLVNAGSPGLVIRPMRPSEREHVERVVWPWLLERRIQAHDAGQITFLVGWLGDEPVCHVLVRWWTDDPRHAHLPRVPFVEHLGVVEQWRNQGCGWRLMDAAEALARSRGHERVILAVALDNHGARRLYERRGYRDLGFEPQLLSWTFTDADGVERTEGNLVTWLESPSLTLAA